MRRLDGSPVDPAVLRRMTDALTHRGPDGDGYFVRGSVGLGHRRLSIIDLEQSKQPMSDVDDQHHVCFNGEILNYGDLRKELSYPYRTSGDTEVLLALYRERGIDGVAKLVGQFAYALFDERSLDLWLVRDRVGILPLYYYADDEVFLFASEPKAILAAGHRAAEVDEASLFDYLGRASVRAPSTLFRGISKLAPGEVLRIRADGRRETRVYWTIPEPTPAGAKADSSVVVDDLSHLLTQAVERNLVADVPVGAYLSGGLDSSLIVALAAGLHRGGALETFAAGFGDPRHDELPHARRVSELFGTNHHEVNVRPDDFIDLWPLLTWHRDAPVSQSSDVAVYRLAELARQVVKVALSGEGSDELFGGYPKHRFAGATTAAGLVPHAVRSRALGRLQHVLPARSAKLRIAVRAMTEATESDRFEAWFAPFTRDERVALLGSDSVTDRARRRAAGDPLRRMLADDLDGWLPDNLLERADRMSMARSLEVRPPFLDRDVVDFAFGVPSELKVRNGEGKWIVKQVARRHLPDEIIDRQKVGFRVPLDDWFRNGLRDFVHDRLLGRDSFVATVLDRPRVEQLVADHVSGRRSEELRLWTLLSLEVWHDVFFRQGGAVGVPPASAAS